MSQEAVTPAAAPSQPTAPATESLPATEPLPAAEPLPAQAPEQSDALLKLAQVDIPRDQARIKGLVNPTIEQLLTEIHATDLSVIREVALALVAQRDWAYQTVLALSNHLEEVDQRIDTLEEVVLNDGTAILADDAQVLANVVVGCKFLAEQLLNGPFPIVQRDTEGQTKLQELISLCDQAEGIISESTLGDDDDDGEATDDPETAPDATSSEQN